MTNLLRQIRKYILLCKSILLFVNLSYYFATPSYHSGIHLSTCTLSLTLHSPLSTFYSYSEVKVVLVERDTQKQIINTDLTLLSFTEPSHDIEVLHPTQCLPFLK